MLRINLGVRVTRACEEFARIMGDMNQAHNFNNPLADKRSASKVSKDTLMGKLGEAGVILWLKTNGLAVSNLDLVILGVNKRDDGDVKCEGAEISIKTTERGGFLLVHTAQLKWELADIYIVCQSGAGHIKMMGYAYKKDLINEDLYSDWINQSVDTKDLVGSRAELVLAGEKLPTKNFTMQATNIFIRPKNLRTDFYELLDYLDGRKYE